jgi:hypothetical protein
VTDRFRLPLAAFAALVLSLAMLAPPSAADEEPAPADLSGTYEIAGTFTNGNAYTGTVEIKKRKNVQLRKGPKYGFCDLKFKYSSGWEGIGVGALVDGRFYFALTGNKKSKFCSVTLVRPTVLSPELTALLAELRSKNTQLEDKWHHGKAENQNYYTIKGDPWYTDVWTYPKYSMWFRLDGDWGTEGVRPPLVNGVESTEEKALGEGEWWWFQSHYDDKGKDNSAVFGNYGRMMIDAPAEGGAIKITRNLWDSDHRKLDEDDWNCVGLMVAPETLVMMAGGDDSSGVGYYEFAGKTLKGKICDVGDDESPYDQTLTAPDDVVARNAALFR